MKAKSHLEAKKLTDIPNIGKAVEGDLLILGIKRPLDLKGKDGIKLYEKLCKITGKRHDPCMADTFMAAVDFMNGGEPRPWWHFTDERKKLLS